MASSSPVEPPPPKELGRGNQPFQPAQRKRALISGASRGIGRATALGLARLGFDLSLLVRNRARGENVEREIEALGLGTEVELLVADLSDLRQVGRAADEFCSLHRKLDVFISNAGAWYSERRLSVDGFELTFAVNQLAPFVLVHRLLPALIEADSARIVVVASRAHRRARMQFDDLMHEHGYRGFSVYAESKLANILFARELARRLSATAIKVNALHPGFVASNFGRETTHGPLRLLLLVAQLLARSERRGAETSVYLATSEDVREISGGYFADCRRTEPSVFAQSDQDAARLWEVCQRLCVQAGIGPQQLGAPQADH